MAEAEEANEATSDGWMQGDQLRTSTQSDDFTRQVTQLKRVGALRVPAFLLFGFEWFGFRPYGLDYRPTGWTTALRVGLPPYGWWLVCFVELVPVTGVYSRNLKPGNTKRRKPKPPGQERKEPSVDSDRVAPAQM